MMASSRYTTVVDGDLSVTMDGPQWKVTLPVDSWDTQLTLPLVLVTVFTLICGWMM